MRQQAITWANVDSDLCHHMVSLGQNELILVGFESSNDLTHWALGDAEVLFQTNNLEIYIKENSLQC